MILTLLFVVLLMLGRHTSLLLFDRVHPRVGSALFTVVGEWEFAPSRILTN